MKGPSPLGEMISKWILGIVFPDGESWFAATARQETPRRNPRPKIGVASRATNWWWNVMKHSMKRMSLLGSFGCSKKVEVPKISKGTHRERRRNPRQRQWSIGWELTSDVIFLLSPHVTMKLSEWTYTVSLLESWNWICMFHFQLIGRGVIWESEYLYKFWNLGVHRSKIHEHNMPSNAKVAAAHLLQRLRRYGGRSLHEACQGPSHYAEGWHEVPENQNGRNLHPKSSSSPSPKK